MDAPKMEITSCRKLRAKLIHTKYALILSLLGFVCISTFSSSQAQQNETHFNQTNLVPLLPMAKEKKIEITFDFLELDNQKKIGKAKGKVFAKRNDFVICCDEAYISYNNDNVEIITCKNNVQMYHYQGKHGKSDEALFTATSNQIIMTGNPMLIENENVLTGDSIIYDMKSDKAKVEGNAKITWNPKTKKSDTDTINFRSWSYQTCASGSISL